MIPELPRLGALLRLAAQRDASLQNAIDLLEGAPELAGEVVQLANTDAYGMEGRITRLERVVLILGLPAAAEIAATLVARRALAAHPGGSLLFPHSVEVALAAAELARELGLARDRDAYVAGLFHELAALDPEPGRWGFPEPLERGLAAACDPGSAASASRDLSTLVCVAHLAAAPGGAGALQLAPARASELAAELGLTRADLDAVQARAEPRAKALQVARGAQAPATGTTSSSGS